MDKRWARDRFCGTRVARLATADADGRPHLVPIVFAVIEDQLVTVIDGKPKTAGARLRRLANIAANPEVSVLVDGYDEDWSRLWWARADGTARIIELTDAAETAASEQGADAETVRRALVALTERYPQYRDTPPPGPLIAITVRRWSGWAAGTPA